MSYRHNMDSAPQDGRYIIVYDHPLDGSRLGMVGMAKWDKEMGWVFQTGERVINPHSWRASCTLPSVL